MRINYGTDVRRIGELEFFTGEDTGEDTRTRFIEDDAEYGRALDTLAITCVDLAVVRHHLGEFQILLGKRQQEPQPDWWVIGGRMRHGQTWGNAAAANAKRELGLTLDRTALHEDPIGVYNTWWDRREQEPQHHGVHTVNVTMLYRIADTEVSGIVPNKEYAEIDWFDVSHLQADPDHSYHPCLRKIAADVLRKLDV